MFDKLKSMVWEEEKVVTPLAPVSQARAKAVEAYLVSRGFPDNRINIDFKGDTQPISKDDSVNRRVVIEMGK
jgi:outer membrane protein OmpA-like peptidoglycan-associated protein